MSAVRCDNNYRGMRCTRTPHHTPMHECGGLYWVDEDGLAERLYDLAARMDAIERADPLEERLSALERQVARMAAPPARQPRHRLATPPPGAPFVSTNDEVGRP